MIAKVLEAKNLYKAERQVVRNKGAGGIDGMRYLELSEYIEKNRSTILSSIRNNNYQAQF